MTTMRAVRCRVCQEPTGSFFDADEVHAPEEYCGGCRRPEDRPTPEWRGCEHCGSHEFSYSETRTSWVNTEDSRVVPGDMIYFADPEYNDGSGTAQCADCGTPIRDYEVG